MKPVFQVALLLCVAATSRTQVIDKGLIPDLDADKGVEVEDGDRVVKWTNQVAASAAKDFVKRDEGRREPGSKRPTLKRSVAAIRSPSPMPGRSARRSRSRSWKNSSGRGRP